MKQKKQVPPLKMTPAAKKDAVKNFLQSIPAFILGLALFLSPLFPDEKLNRMKLVVLGLGLVVAGVAWAIKQVFSQKLVLWKSPLDTFLLLYMISAAFYYWFSPNPSAATNELHRMFFCVGAYFLFEQIACAGQEREETWIFGGWMAGLFLISIYGILQKTGGMWHVQVPQMQRVYGTFGNPIFFAAFLIISIPVGVAWLAQTKNRAGRRFLILCLLLALWALSYTGTRAAFLALPLSMVLFYAFLEWRQGWVRTKRLWTSRKKIGIVLAAGMLLHFFLQFTSGGYAQKVEGLKGLIVASRVTATQQTHTLIWKDVLKMWVSHPVFGTGYGTFHVEFPQYASEELKKVFPQNERIVNDAHNEYLQVLAETGLMGFLIFMAMFVVFYGLAFKELLNRTQHPDSREWVLPAGLLCGMTAILIQNFFSVDMRFIVSSVYVFMCMGLMAATFAKPFEISWGAGWKAGAKKSAWILLFLILSGAVGFRPKPTEFYIGGIYRFAPTDAGPWVWTKTPSAGPGLFPAILRPYVTQKYLASAPDFFDEKLLNNAQSIQDLEKLTQQYPQQWQYWEKLGFALAKEMQHTAADGQKVIDRKTTELALGAYMRANQLNPKAEGPTNNLGNIYYTIGQRGEALEWWKKTVENNPEKIDARVNLGLAYYKEGKIKESADQLHEVLKRDPQNQKALVILRGMVE